MYIFPFFLVHITILILTTLLVLMILTTIMILMILMTLMILMIMVPLHPKLAVTLRADRNQGGLHVFPALWLRSAFSFDQQ